MKVIVLIPVDEKQKQALMDIDSNVVPEFIFTTKVDVTDEMVSDAEIIVGNISFDHLKAAKKLSLLQLDSAGYHGYTNPGVLPEGALLANATGAYGLALSEHMIGSLLSMIKKLPVYNDYQKEHEWKDAGMVKSIWGSRTLVVGLGNIGSEFAMRMKAFGSTVVGLKRTVGEKPAYIDELYTIDHLEEQLPLADFVACSMPSSKSTYHLFDMKKFELMKDDAIFLNVGRGDLVDPLVLADALNQGVIGGACIDVSDPEPLPKDHSLWDAKNLCLTPHVAGGFHLEETKNRILAIAKNNITAVCNGTKICNRID